MNRRHAKAAQSTALFDSPTMTAATLAMADARDKFVAAGVQPE